MAEGPANARCSTPLSCWLSSTPLHFSLGLGHGLQVSARVQLPNKRCKVCRGDTSNAAVILSPEAASVEQVGGLAWELQKRIEAHGDVRGQLERGAEPIDPDFYARWLKSKGSLDEAEMCIRAHAAWREAFVTCGRIQEDEIVRELAAQKAFLQGCDREGHPVLVVWAARHDMGDRSIDETKRFICYCLDNTIAAADFSRNPRGQILCLFDLSGLRTRNLDVKALQAVFELLQSHYPERLHALWFLNAPFIFWGVWRMVRPFIRTEETKSKIVFMSGSSREAALRENIAADVLPEVYGGDAELVPVEKAALKHLMQQQQQQRKQSKHAAKRKASTIEAVKSSRVASAGRVLSRWSSSAWSVAKKPAVAAWAHLPHWQHMPRVRLRHSSKAGGPSRTATLTRTLSRHFSLRRPAFSMRPRPRRPPSKGAPGSRPLLRQMLSPLFLIEVFRLLTISAAQALYYVWSHAVPLRLQRPRGDSPRLPSAAPEAATLSPPPRPDAVHSSAFGAPAEGVMVTEASAACSSGSDREEKSPAICEGAAGAGSSSGNQTEEHASQAAIVDSPIYATEPDNTQDAALQQRGQFLLLLAALLLIGLVMFVPDVAAYLGNVQSRTILTSTLI